MLRAKGRRLRILRPIGISLLFAAATTIHTVGATAADIPAATASPNSGLHDGQTGISVRGSGFPPYRVIQIEECQGTATNPPRDNTSCDGDTLDSRASTDAHGTFVNAPGAGKPRGGYRVYTLPSPTLGLATSITCDASDPCVLYVGVEQGDFGQPHTFVSIHFAADASAPTTSASPSASAARPVATAVTSAPPPTAAAVSPPVPASGAGSGPGPAASPDTAPDPAVSVGTLAATGAPTGLRLVGLAAFLVAAAAESVRRVLRLGRHGGRPGTSRA